jgi:NAD(P) transhydrogenase subunit beta
VRHWLASIGATELTFLAAAALFILSLHWMNSVQTAWRAVLAGVLAMSLAVFGAILDPHVINWLVLLVALRRFRRWHSLSWVPLTAVPQRTALSHAFGGLAAGLLGTAKFYDWLGTPELTWFKILAIVAEVILGFLTFTGSLMAAAKLQEIKWIPQRPVTYKYQNESNLEAQ